MAAKMEVLAGAGIIMHAALCDAVGNWH